jgi:hypothetical protein
MSVQLCYQVGVIGYFHLNRAYVAEVLCVNKEEPISTCHGQCFLKQNLKVTEESKDAQAPASNTKTEMSLYVIAEILHLPEHKSESITISSVYSITYHFEYIRTSFRPPCLS